MRRLSIAAIASLVCCTVASYSGAQVVIQNSNLLLGPTNPGDGSNYAFTVYQDAAANDPTSIWVKYNRPNIQVISTNIDEGSDWYVVHPGDVFSAANIQAGAFTKLIEVSQFGFLYPAANVGQSDFWLGVATGKTLFGPRTVFGWVQLHPLSSTEMTMVENVVSYNSSGIIVGTTAALPEPSALAIISCGMLGAVSARRHRRK